MQIKLEEGDIKEQQRKQKQSSDEEMIVEVVDILSKKAIFLGQMIHFEMYDTNQNITNSEYPFSKQLRYIAYKVLLELQEVIEIFTTPYFYEDTDKKEGESSEWLEKLDLADRLHKQRENNLSIKS